MRAAVWKKARGRANLFLESHFRGTVTSIPSFSSSTVGVRFAAAIEVAISKSQLAFQPFLGSTSLRTARGSSAGFAVGTLRLTLDPAGGWLHFGIRAKWRVIPQLVRDAVRQSPCHPPKGFARTVGWERPQR